MPTEVILSIVAVVISLISLVYTMMQSRRQEFIAGLLNNLSTVSETERMIADDPSLLELHGITQKDLEDCGISALDIAYLLSNFTAGGMYYDIKKKKSGEAFAVGTYRYNMLRSERTRRAWPILRQLMEPSPYRDKIERTINQIEDKSLVA